MAMMAGKDLPPKRIMGTIRVGMARRKKIWLGSTSGNTLYFTSLCPPR
jgi:hypothetical protein